MSTDIKTKYRMYMYNSYRDRCGNLAWKDLQTGRFITATTCAKRTGLPLSHIKAFENGADGRGYQISREQRHLLESSLGVCLLH